MPRHPLAHDDVALEAILTETASGPVALARAGRPVGVVLSTADDHPLVANPQTGFFAALRGFRAQHGGDALDLGAVLEGVRDLDPGRSVDD